jgi:hypothetical protein
LPSRSERGRADDAVQAALRSDNATPPFDDTFPVGPEIGNSAFFGRNVLQGLVDGIDDFIQERQSRWKQFHSLGPTLLGSAMWINDEALIDKISELAAACIVVYKQGRKENRSWSRWPS